MVNFTVSNSRMQVNMNEKHHVFFGPFWHIWQTCQNIFDISFNNIKTKDVMYFLHLLFFIITVEQGRQESKPR